MRAQHAATAAQLDRLDELMDAWEAAAGATEREAVATLLDEVRDTLLAHLGQEETQILPTASTVMSQREWGLLHEHGMSSIPKDRLFLQLGWILEVVPADERAGWLRTNLPAPARVLWRLVGQAPVRRAPGAGLRLTAGDEHHLPARPVRGLAHVDHREAGRRPATARRSRGPRNRSVESEVSTAPSDAKT